MTAIDSTSNQAASLPRLAAGWLHLSVLAIGAVLLFAGLQGGPAMALTLGFAISWAIMAVGYDVFSGLSGRINMGFAMFPGIAAYGSGLLQTKAGFSVWASAPLGILCAVMVAALLGLLSLRIQGKYFALTTSILPLALFQLVNILDFWLGGEEGITGLDPFFFLISHASRCRSLSAARPAPR